MAIGDPTYNIGSNRRSPEYDITFIILFAMRFIAARKTPRADVGGVSRCMNPHIAARKTHQRL
jgi:hypothetical protein